MIDPCLDAKLCQALIDMRSPCLAPMLQQLRAVPIPDLGAEPVLVHGAHGQHDMGMGLGTAVFADVPMDVEIGDHALGNKLALHKIARQFDSLRLAHLAGNRELDLAGELSILALLGGFDCVPEKFAVTKLIGNALQCHNLGMNDAALVGEVMASIERWS